MRVKILNITLLFKKSHEFFKLSVQIISLLCVLINLRLTYPSAINQFLDCLLRIAVKVPLKLHELLKHWIHRGIALQLIV